MSISQDDYMEVTPKSLLRDDKKEKKELSRAPEMKLSKTFMGSSGLSLPPRLEATVNVQDSHFRFEAASSSTVSASFNDIFGALGGIVVVANSNFKPWASSYRIKSITAWPPSGSSASLSWNIGTSGQQRDQETCQDVPTGVTSTKPIVFRPPKHTLAGDWVLGTASNTNHFTMIVTAGTIIDLHVQFTLSNQVQAGSLSISTGTLGLVYYLPLDGAGSNIIQQIHLPTTH